MKPFDESMAQLDDYVRGNLPESDVDSFEEELFARALRDEAPELAFREDLGRTLLGMRDRGTLDVWLTARGVADLVASGAKVARFDLDLANPGAPDFSQDFDLLVTRVPLSFDGVDTLEADVMTPDGRVLKTMPDIRFDREDGAVYACCERELAIVAAQVSTVTRVWARSSAGRRLVAEIRFQAP